MIRNRKLLIGAIVTAFVLIVFLGSFLFYQFSLRPVASESELVTFEVMEGDSSSSVITRLDEQGIIQNATMAKIYARFQCLHEVKAGSFQLDKSWSTREILRYLNDANHANAHQVTITFREGIWAKDIAAALEEKLDVSADELIALWNDETYLKTLIDKYEFLSDDILNDQVRVALEGYLYPETYAFELDATKEEITETFLNQFEKVYETYKDDLSSSNVSMHDIITMASMVQYEASTTEDMGLVSGVFYNRLAINMHLGSSVTICYALYDEYKTAEDCELNANIDSPYNTYLYAGLPVGPILNPGKDAIMAALHPTENDYYYFMADIYGDGTVYYARTQEEHDANVNKYLR